MHQKERLQLCPYVAILGLVVEIVMLSAGTKFNRDVTSVIYRVATACKKNVQRLNTFHVVQGIL